MTVIDPECPQNELIHQLFEEHVERAPAATAVVYQDEVLTYSQLNARANQLAHYLREQGVCRGEYLPVLMPRCLRMLIAQLAVLKVGAVYVPLDPTLPSERLQFMVQDCQARRVLGEGPDPGLRLASVRWIDCATAVVAEFPVSNAPTGQEFPTLPAYVMYTSGSTGAPKGVVIPHRGVKRLVINGGYANIDTADCIAHCSNPAFDASTFEIWGALLNGAVLVILTQSEVLEPKRLVKALTQHHITILLLTTALFNLHALASLDTFAGLRYLLFGGEAADLRAVRKVLASGFRGRLLNIYGPTETTAFATWYPTDSLEPDSSNVPIGRPISNTEVYILDAARQPVPTGVEGEIYIGGVGVALGYLNRPALTAERFIADSFGDEPGARIYKTGDIGRWLPGDIVEYRGRNDQQVKIRGLRIEPGEIESQIARYPGVKEVAVLVREDTPGEKRLIAYITSQDSGCLYIEALRSYLKSVLPDYMVPGAVVILEQLPLTPNGKLDRKALPAPGREAYESRSYEAPRGELERSLAVIWQEILRVERVGREDNFFELGGHSLLGARLLAVVAERLGLEPADFTIFQTPTIREMASSIERLLLASTDVPLRPRLPGERIPLSFAQQWLWQTARLDEVHGSLSEYSALRLSGPLNYDALLESHSALLRRHESLRTRIVRVANVLEQRVGTCAGYELTMFDLSRLAPAEREKEAQRLAEQLILEPYTVIGAPLFAARLLKLSPLDHRLIMAMDHIIADGVSLGILTRDLCALYTQLTHGKPCTLPSIPIQFADYAVWQHKAHATWVANHSAYWTARLAGAQRTELFGNEVPPAVRANGKYAMYHFQFGEPLIAAVDAFSRRNRTTTVISFLTAFVIAVAAWSGKQDVVIPFSMHGRLHRELDNVIGCFSAPLFLRVEMRMQDTLLELAEQVYAEYGTAQAHYDGSRLAAQVPEPAYQWNPFFNWIPQGIYRDPTAMPAQIHPYDLTIPLRQDVQWSPEILLALIARPGEIAGLFHYRADRIPADTVERFAHGFRLVVETLAGAPQTQLSSVWESIARLRSS